MVSISFGDCFTRHSRLCIGELWHLINQQYAFLTALWSRCVSGREHKWVAVVMDIGISILIYITYAHLYCLQLLLVTLDSEFIGLDCFMIIE